MTIPTTTDKLSNIALAGAAAEGSGALIGWNGLGSLSRATILECLAEARLPADWAPAVKSSVGYAGRAVSALNNLGYRTRRARGASWRRGDVFAPRTREYRARWIVISDNADDGAVGQAAGEVMLTVELRDGSEDIHVDGHQSLADAVVRHFNTMRDEELYSAGDVTAWMRSVLIRECGAARFGVGYYVPGAGRDIASRLATALAAQWGTGWICPLLPVATSSELRTGLARGFYDEVSGVARSLQSAREAARKDDSKAEITAAVAARLLRELADVDARADAYRALCGNEALAGAAAQLRELHDTLAPLADDASMRFAMLDLSGDIAPAPAPIAVNPARALEARQAEIAAERREAPAAPVAEQSVAYYRARYRAAMESSGLGPKAFHDACVDRGPIGEWTPALWAEVAERVVAETSVEPTAPAAPVAPTPTPEPSAPAPRPIDMTEPTPEPTPEPENTDASERFAMLDL